jgi:hypothetical protein
VLQGILASINIAIPFFPVLMFSLSLLLPLGIILFSMPYVRQLNFSGAGRIFTREYAERTTLN